MGEFERRRAIDRALAGMPEPQRDGLLPAGCSSLTAALGGLPRGRIVEVYGDASSGKTTMALQAAAACQEAGGSVAFIDAEHALDAAWAVRLGVDAGQLIVVRPEDGEQAIEIACALLASRSIDLLVVDSVAAMVPPSFALHADLIARGLRRISQLATRSGTCVLMLNQLRQSVDGETTTGGRALRLQAAVRVEVRPGAVKVVKNSLALCGPGSLR